MPLVNRTFDQLIDFTRTSAATFVNSSGNIASTPQSRNLLTFTQEFSNAAWGKSNATITANSTAAPDGTMTADTFIPNNGSTDGNFQQIVSGVSAGVAYTASYYVKAAGLSSVRFRLTARTAGNTFISEMQVDANLSAGTVGAVTAGTFTSTSASISAVGNGWYRVSITGISPATTGIFWTSVRYAPAGDGTSGFFIWGAQLEQASSATDYTRNFGGLFPPRFDYDPVTLAPRGLLIEEQRTNLLLRSEEFDNAAWTKSAVTATANATTSPDGTVDADSLVADTSTGGHQATQTATTAATATTFSVYAKQNGYTWVGLGITDSGSTVRVSYFNLAAGTVGTVGTGITASIVNAGNGWYRCIVTVATALAGSNTLRVYVTNADNVTSFTGDGTSGIFIYGAQLEAGAFATSYIPTVASQVTRSADVAAINAPNFASWYNQSEGTMLVEYTQTAATASVIKALAVTSDGTSNNRVYAYVSTAGLPNGLVTTGGVAQANPTNSAISSGVTVKTALAYKTDDFALATNGGTVATDTSGSVPTVNRLDIGWFSGTSANQANGHIRSIRYYPVRLSNAQLQALTA